MPLKTGLSLVLATLVISIQSNAQDKKWSFCLEFNPNIDQTSTFDEGNRISQQNLYSFSTGLFIQRDASSQLSVQSGIQFKLARNELLIPINDFLFLAADELYLFNLPFRIEYAPWKESHDLPLFFRTGVQLVFQPNALYEEECLSCFGIARTAQAEITYDSKYPYFLTSLWELGIGFEFEFKQVWSLATSLNWISGRNALNELDAVYQINNERPMRAVSIYTGNHVSFGIQLKRRVF